MPEDRETGSGHESERPHSQSPFNLRARESGTFVNDVTKNPYVWAAFAICCALLAAALWIAPLARTLSVVPPPPVGWTIVAVASLAPMLIGQAVAIIRSSFRRSKNLP